MIASNDHIIYDVDPGWCGGTHDARDYRTSNLRVFLETDPTRLMIAADSTYPISLKVMKHYEHPANCMQRELDNPLNGLRTVSSENVYGRLKQRFPILGEMRSDFSQAQRIVVTCCVLHNMAEHFLDEVSADVDGNDPHGRPLVDADHKGNLPFLGPLEVKVDRYLPGYRIPKKAGYSEQP